MPCKRRGTRRTQHTVPMGAGADNLLKGAIRVSDGAKSRLGLPTRCKQDRASTISLRTVIGTKFANMPIRYRRSNAQREAILP